MCFRQFVSFVACGLFPEGTSQMYRKQCISICTRQEGTVSFSKQTQIPFGEMKKWRLKVLWGRESGTGGECLGLRGVVWFMQHDSAWFFFLSNWSAAENIFQRSTVINTWQRQETLPKTNSHTTSHSLDPAENGLSFVVVDLNVHLKLTEYVFEIVALELIILNAFLCMLNAASWSVIDKNYSFSSS